MTDDQYAESRKKGSGKGFLGAWGPAIGGFLVAGPFGAAVGAGLGELVSRKINTGDWTGSYDNGSESEANFEYQNEYESEIDKYPYYEEEANSIFDNYSRLYENFDFSDFILNNINDSQVKNDYIKFIRFALLVRWKDNADNNSFLNDFPSDEKPIVDASTWQDLPAFLDHAFLPRLRNSNDELLWVLKIKDRYPEKLDIKRDIFVIYTLFFYLDVIATLESYVGRDIAKNYGEPNTSDPKYWEIKREINDFYKLQNSPEEILEYLWGKDNYYKIFDEYIETRLNSAYG